MSLNVVSGLQVRILAENVPETVQHGTRKAELEQIPLYIVASPEAVESLALCNVQNATPGVDARPYPWIKVDANGSIVGIYSWDSVATAWVGPLFGSDTWDPGSIAAGAEEVKEITVTGAALGDFVNVSFSLDVEDLTLTAQVTAADTVTVQLSNNTGGAIDLAEGTVYVKVTPRV